MSGGNEWYGKKKIIKMNTLQWEVYPHQHKYYKGEYGTGVLLASLVCQSIIRDGTVHRDMVMAACSGPNAVEHTAIQWNEAKEFLNTVLLLSGYSKRKQRECMMAERAMARRMIRNRWRQRCVELDNNISQLHWEYEHAAALRDATVQFLVDLAGDVVTEHELQSEWDEIVLEDDVVDQG